MSVPNGLKFNTLYLVYCSNDYAATEPEATNSPVAVAVPTEAENISTVPNSNCRQVTRNNLPVRNKPEGQLVGRLPRNQQVFMANEGFNGWVPIEAPINGYVPAEYLTACTGNTADLSTANSEPLATVDGTNCRLVMSPDVPLRAEPMGNIIGTLNKNERVYIANEGFDGWVPIESPASGYVTAANLGQCVPAQ